MQITRLRGNPIIAPELDERLGTNINGPSLIRVPHWLPDPLGRYYLYFAHHKGDFIRLAYADALEGPWRVHAPGTLTLAGSGFPTARPPREALLGKPKRATAESEEDQLTPHIASPDVHVDEARREIRMYFHGLLEDLSQLSRVATSRDGLGFDVREPLLAQSYLRAFEHQGVWYGIAMPGVLYRSRDGLGEFESGPQLFADGMRHAALQRVGPQALRVFWTRIGDAPERILCSVLETVGDWQGWRVHEPVEVLRPEFDWEGADVPIAPSLRGAIGKRVNQLRDPCVYVEGGEAFLLYSVAGESGIAIARIGD